MGNSGESANIGEKLEKVGKVGKTWENVVKSG